MQLFQGPEQQSWAAYLALVNVNLAVPSGEAEHAGAGVVVDTVQATGAVQTGVALALVNVGLAVDACKEEKTVKQPPRSVFPWTHCSLCSP